MACFDGLRPSDFFFERSPRAEVSKNDLTHLTAPGGIQYRLRQQMDQLTVEVLS
jgi:hypothetical protein